MTNPMNNSKTFHLLLLILACCSQAFSQNSLSQEEAIQIALKNNPMVKSGEYLVASQEQLKNASFDFGKTNIVWMHGQFNSILKDNNYTISQSIPFPTAIASQAKLASARIESAEIELTMTKNELVKNVRAVYHQLVYTLALHDELKIQDSLFAAFAKAAIIRHRVGEGTLLEKTTASTQSLELQNQLAQNESDITIYKRQLQTLLNTMDEISPVDVLTRIDPVERVVSSDTNPQLKMLWQDVTIADRLKKAERSKLLPDIMIGYFAQSLIGYQRINNNDVYFDKNDLFTGFELGVSFPLWFVPQQSRSKAAHLNQEATVKKYEFFQNKMEGELQSAQLELAKNENALRFYETDGNANADLIFQQAQRSYQEGEIGYLEFFQAVNQARTIKLAYLKTINQHNQAAIYLDYLVGKY